MQNKHKLDFTCGYYEWIIWVDDEAYWVFDSDEFYDWLDGWVDDVEENVAHGWKYRDNGEVIVTEAVIEDFVNEKIEAVREWIRENEDDEVKDFMDWERYATKIGDLSEQEWDILREKLVNGFYGHYGEE